MQIRDFYHWCNAKNIFLNVPDFYFLNGSNKTAMGYRESNWSLPLTRTLRLPLYYTGLSKSAKIKIGSDKAKTVVLERDYSVQLTITLPAGGMQWVTVE